jgi:tetratricopeptide (TPR) repeat protein
MENIAIRVSQPGSRWAVGGLVCVAAFVLAVISARWAIAETALQIVPNVDVLEKARAWEPANGELPYRLGLFYLDFARPTDPVTAIPFLEDAVRLSPNNASYWLAVGRARERTNRASDAEKALARAVTLAPSYWEPRWILANYYIRRGMLDQAGEHLRKAVASNGELTGQAVRTVYAASGRDTVATSRVIGKSIALRNGFLDFLQQSGKLDDAVAVWGAFAAQSDDLDGSMISRGHTLSAALLNAGRSADAIALWKRLDPNRAPALDTVRNPRFEQDPQSRVVTPFDWVVNRYADCWSSADRDLSRGFRALRVQYTNAGGGTNYVHAKQTVLVTPGAAYTLRFEARLENIITGGPPNVSVNDLSGRELGAVDLPVSGIPIDWTRFQFDFVAPANGLVDMEIERKACPGVCPIFGSIYVTDFALTRRAG